MAECVEEEVEIACHHQNKNILFSIDLNVVIVNSIALRATVGVIAILLVTVLFNILVSAHIFLRVVKRCVDDSRHVENFLESQLFVQTLTGIVFVTDQNEWFIAPLNDETCEILCEENAITMKNEPLNSNSISIKFSSPLSAVVRFGLH